MADWRERLGTQGSDPWNLTQRLASEFTNVAGISFDHKTGDWSASGANAKKYWSEHPVMATIDAVSVAMPAFKWGKALKLVSTGESLAGKAWKAGRFASAVGATDEAAKGTRMFSGIYDAVKLQRENLYTNSAAERWITNPVGQAPFTKDYADLAKSFNANRFEKSAIADVAGREFAANQVAWRNSARDVLRKLQKANLAPDQHQKFVRMLEAAKDPGNVADRAELLSNFGPDATEAYGKTWGFRAKLGDEAEKVDMLDPERRIQQKHYMPLMQEKEYAESLAESEYRYGKVIEDASEESFRHREHSIEEFESKFTRDFNPANAVMRMAQAGQAVAREKYVLSLKNTGIAQESDDLFNVLLDGRTGPLGNDKIGALWGLSRDRASIVMEELKGITALRADGKTVPEERMARLFDKVGWTRLGDAAPGLKLPPRFANTYVDKAVVNDIIGSLKFSEASLLPEWYDTVMATFKMSKTTLNPAGHVRNMFGAMVFHGNATNLLNGFTSALGGWSKGRAILRDTSHPLYTKVMEAGIVESVFDPVERRQINDLIGQVSGRTKHPLGWMGDSRIADYARAGADRAGKFYRGIDEVSRVDAWAWNYERFSSANAGAVKKYAAWKAMNEAHGAKQFEREHRRVVEELRQGPIPEHAIADRMNEAPKFVPETQYPNVEFHGSGASGIRQLQRRFEGSGEGNAAFGRGHYMAQQEGIGRYYKTVGIANNSRTQYFDAAGNHLDDAALEAIHASDNLADQVGFDVGARNGVDNEGPNIALDMYTVHRQQLVTDVENIRSGLYSATDIATGARIAGVPNSEAALIGALEKDIRVFDQKIEMVNSGTYTKIVMKRNTPKGGLYKVRQIGVADDENILFDVGLEQNPGKVQRALNDLMYKVRRGEYGPDHAAIPFNSITDDTARLYKRLAQVIGEDNLQAELLRREIKGIKFLDNTSRKGHGGTYNFVTFADENIEVLAEGNRLKNSAYRDAKIMRKAQRENIKADWRAEAALDDQARDLMDARDWKPEELPRPHDAWTEEELADRAAAVATNQVHKLIPSGAGASPMAKFVRQGIPFSGFSHEAIRVWKNAMVEKPHNALFWNHFSTTTSELFGAIGGFSPEEVESARANLPYYTQNKQMMMLPVRVHGVPNFIDMSYPIPLGNITDLESDEAGFAQKALGMVGLNPVANPLFAVATATATGQDPFRLQALEPQRTERQMGVQIEGERSRYLVGLAEYTANTMLPPLLGGSAGWNIVENLRDQRQPQTGAPLEDGFLNTIATNVVGIRLQEADANTAMMNVGHDERRIQARLEDHWKKWAWAQANGDAALARATEENLHDLALQMGKDQDEADEYVADGVERRMPGELKNYSLKRIREAYARVSTTTTSTDADNAKLLNAMATRMRNDRRRAKRPKRAKRATRESR